ncbi:hypothetical protein [Neisseria shayeganii]|uniref:Uncharacterized protein n=1 Tax=Neisseria shayeganii 871 TaxID=1032488 RepID=G4CJF4_9NEIS|nr:hypothetical protein [Neisseria shayeganii]EGY52005.1 hypothetical protein HMPREF9371_1744 [Neisseria shayeganii 871]
MEVLAVLFVLFMAAVYLATFVIGSMGLTLWAGASAWKGVRFKAAEKQRRQQQAERHAQAVSDYRKPYDAQRSAENLAYWQQRLKQDNAAAH